MKTDGMAAAKGAGGGGRSRSLRARVAAAYLGLTALVVLSAGAWMVLAGAHRFRSDLRKQQQRLLRELRWEYLAGAELPGPVGKRDDADAPAAALPTPPAVASRVHVGAFGADSVGGWACLVPAPDGSFSNWVLRADGSVARVEPCRTGDATFLAEVFAEKSFDLGPHSVQFLLLAPDGSERLRSPHDAGLVDAIAAGVRAGRTSFRARAPEAEPGRRTPVSKVYAARLPDGAALAVGASLAPERRYFRQLAAQLALALLVSLLPALLAAGWLARRVARGIGAVSDAARDIAAGDLRRRVPAAGGAREIDELGASFNAMCDANERLVAELRTLSDDIAHDLRTPLTRLRGAAELAATGAAPADALPAEVAEETGAMLELIDTMLEISRAGFSVDRSPREALDLAAETRRVCDLYAASVEERGVALETDLPPGPVPFRGHRGRVQQLLGNLLDNALKFTPRGGRVAVSLRAEAGAARLEVSDTGPGVPEAERELVFRRFWRGDASRALPGNGLGLALVRAVATAYGGSAACLAAPGGGARFVVELPL